MRILPSSHSLFNVDTEDHSVCLFCRSEDKKAIDDYLVESPIEGLTKVISINEVRKLYSAYKDRKKLLSEHTHFICDANVMAQLYNLLGKTFADRNNSPIPVNYKSADKLPGAILKACSASYMHMKGETITVRLGLTSMSESDVLANALEGLDFAVSKLGGGWSDVKAIHLKTSDSPALPIYANQSSEMLEFVKRKIAEPPVPGAGRVKLPKKEKKEKKVTAVPVSKKAAAAAVAAAVVSKVEEAKTPSKKRGRVAEEAVVMEEESSTKVKKSAKKATKKA